MPFALLFAGILLVISAYQNTIGILSAQLKKDLTGKDGFFVWIVAILIVGAVGYVKELQTVSRAFLTLILIVLIFVNKGFFDQFVSAVSGQTDADKGVNENASVKAEAILSKPVDIKPGANSDPGFDPLTIMPLI